MREEVTITIEAEDAKTRLVVADTIAHELRNRGYGVDADTEGPAVLIYVTDPQ